MKLLDCFCGMGGVSDGFALVGYDVTGIDIVDAPKQLGYKHRFIQGDMTKLNGSDFKGFDVIWGSPPCRDFSQVNTNGHGWKRPKDPEFGMITVKAFLDFVEAAAPTYWIMENVSGLSKYLPNPKVKNAKIGFKRHVFYGNFPPFLLPESSKFAVRSLSGWTPNVSWIRAKIPLGTSLAFANACLVALNGGREKGI